MGLPWGFLAWGFPGAIVRASALHLWDRVSLCAKKCLEKQFRFKIDFLWFNAYYHRCSITTKSSKTLPTVYTVKQVCTRWFPIPSIKGLYLSVIYFLYYNCVTTIEQFSKIHQFNSSSISIQSQSWNLQFPTFNSLSLHYDSIYKIS
jgi:hypothetical protein